MTTISMSDLLEAGVHFGHQTNRWNPRMEPYIFGERNGIHIIDLSRTVRLFAKARDFITRLTSEDGEVVFVGTKKQAQDAIRQQAERAGQFHVTNRWLGGTLTNWRTIRHSIQKLKDLDQMARDGSYAKYTKKEVMRFERERERLERDVGGIRGMDGHPDAMFIVDPHKEEIALREANKLDIPVVAICDTNCDPEMVDYVIPGNDDAIRSIRLFSGALADACLEGAKRASEKREESAREAAKEASEFHVADDQADEGPEVQRISTADEAGDEDEESESAEEEEAPAVEG